MNYDDAVRLVVQPDWSHVHEPTVDNPSETEFAAANQRGRVGAVGLLSSILPGLPLADLAQTTDSAVFHKTESVAALRDLFDAEQFLDRLLVERGLHGRQLALARDGAYLQEDLLLAPIGDMGRPRVQTSQLAALLDRGFTAIFNGVDLRDGVSMRLTEAFERVFGCEVNINGYLSMQPQMSFGAHWDPQETIILQLAGHKTWLLEEPVSLSMNRTVHGESLSGRPVWEGTLEPGAALYVPRGWGHRVRSFGGLTFHYTVTVPRTNGIGVLTRALQRSSRVSDELISLPVYAGEMDLSAHVPSFGTGEASAAVASYKLNVLSRTTQRLTDVLAALDGDVGEMWVRSPSGGGWLAAGRAGDRLIVGTSNRQFAIDPDAAELVAHFADGLARAWPRGDQLAEGIVRRLVQLGVLDVMRGPLPWGHPIADD